VEYAEAGAGHALLAIHGAGGGYDQGLALASAFVGSGYRAIAPSRFGYLRTPVPEHPSLALQADAHACLLDVLGAPAAAVIGVSAGAPSALEFALRSPERCSHLVLLVPAWAGMEPAAPLGPVQQLLFKGALRSDFLSWATIHLAPEIIDRTVLGTPPSAVEGSSRSERARVAAMRRDLLPLSARQAGLSLEAALIEETRAQALEEIRAPTLVVSAEDDGYGTYENARRIAARVRHARFLGYRSGGHLLVGHDAEVMAAIAAFLNDPIANRSDHESMGNRA
jgi:pimeloyl-ACP methyl ester carboxylesterase